MTNPKQNAFISNYFDLNSATFGNCYQSAVNAGYSHNTAKSLTVKRPNWFQEKPGESEKNTPDNLISKLYELTNDSSVSTRDRIRAIELLMKYNGMLIEHKKIESKRIQISLGSTPPPLRVGTPYSLGLIKELSFLYSIC